MATRTRKNAKRYAQHRKTVHPKTDCIFCDSREDDPYFIKQTKSFKIIKNQFPYTQWDGQGVLDHIMVIPKTHTDTLSDLTAHEAIEFVDLISSYEARGYSVYSRAPSSTRKTVFHQHTHLIKLDNKTKRFMVYIKKPYILFMR